MWRRWWWLRAVHDIRFVHHLLLAFILLQTTADGNRGPTTPPRVPLPFNLEIKSYNFNTTIQWEYKITSVSPYFQVEIKNYKTGDNWTVVNNCKRIPQHYCDLSKKIKEPDVFYNVRIKAFLGTEESEYATKRDFCLKIDGIIGPPTLNATVENNKIVLDIWHPTTPSTEKRKKTIGDFYEDFKYVVYIRGNKTSEYVPEECDSVGCTAYIVPTEQEETICLSAQGTSKHFSVTGEKSKEICLDLQNDNARKISPPFNVTIKSYNLFTTVSWEYEITSAVPYFQVETKDSGHGNWTVVKRCRRISQQYCDLSKIFTGPIQSYHVRVKAFLGTEASKYAAAYDFNLIYDGIIGPPTLNATLVDNKIGLEIWHPLVPTTEQGPKTIGDIYDDFEYKVYLTGNDKSEFVASDCDNLGCIAEIVPPAKSEDVCMLARGHSNHWAVISEESKEICIHINDMDKRENLQNKITLITALTLFFALLLMIGCIFYILKVIKKENILPPSLGYVVTSIKPPISLIAEKSKYSQVSISPIKEQIHDKLMEEDKISQTDEWSTTVSQECEDPEYQRAVADVGQQQSDNEQNEIVVEPDTTSNHGDSNHFNTDNDSKDSGISMDTGLCESNEVEKHSSDTKPISSSYGYDKPHVPLDLLIQINKEVYGVEPSVSDVC
ncbi:interferon gamma receptor 1 [Pelobates fuscus]|uniref:interferon gamma receptor 1 n=1 Tax=Pelobates fuscus TaxID=191477 RepID=UPI002FE49268